MNDFNIERFKESIDYYGLEMHQDLVDVFSGNYPLKYGTCFIQKNGEVRVIEERLYSIAYEELNSHEKGWLDMDVVITQIWDRLYFQEDVLMAEVQNEEPPNRLIPFATLFGGDFLCFYFKEAARPQIVVWLHEESDIDDAHVAFVADNLELFFAEAMAKPIIPFFDPESDEYNEEKQWEFVNHLLENEHEIELYVEDFVYLLNYFYLENDVDCEIELFLERFINSLPSDILHSFEDMEKIEPIYNWGNFLFDDDAIECTLLVSKNFEEKKKLKEYVQSYLKGFTSNQINDAILMKKRNAIRVLHALE